MKISPDESCSTFNKSSTSTISETNILKRGHKLTFPPFYSLLFTHPLFPSSSSSESLWSTYTLGYPEYLSSSDETNSYNIGDSPQLYRVAKNWPQEYSGMCRQKWYKQEVIDSLNQCCDELARGRNVDKLASLLEPEIQNIPHEIQHSILNTALCIAVKTNNLICAYMLLLKGANANDPKVDSIPALHRAALNENVDMVRLILMTSSPNIGSYKDYDNRITREVIKNLPGLSLDPNFFEDLEIPPIKEQTLKFFLKNSDETKCLKVMEEGFGIELTYNLTNELLDIATRRKYCKIIQEILNRFVNTEIRFHILKANAVTEGNYLVLRELLNLYPGVDILENTRTNNKFLLEICSTLAFHTHRFLLCHDRHYDTFCNTSGLLGCLKLILEQTNVDVRCADGRGVTLLQHVLNARCYEALCYEAASLLLKQGSYLGSMNESNIADIPAFILSNHLNDCIQLKNEWTDKCTIEFDYRCLMPHDDFTEHKTYRTTREMEVILYIANNDNLKHFLKHPLISSFLYIKWSKIRHVSYANIVFYVMFYFFLNTFILTMSLTYDTSPSKSKKQNICYQDTFLWGFTMGMLLLFTFREILQFIFYPRHYLTDSENWYQILLIVFTFALLCGAGFQIGVTVILLSTWELMTLINHHLFPSTSIEMFRTVCLNFIRLLFPYLVFILAFFTIFYTLFRKNNFSNLGLSLFKTIIMFTGEFDANEIPFSTYPVWSRIVFMLFVFHIVLVLLNLLNGLAINNIAEILHKVEIIGLISRVQLIAYFETMTNGTISFWYWLWIPFNFLSNKIFLFPHYLKDGKMTFKPYDNLIVYDNSKHSSTLKMDPNIIKNAKQIVYDRNKPSNDDIMNEFANLQTKLTQLKIALKSYGK